MLLKWLSGGEATDLGTALADDFVAQAAQEAPAARQRKSKSEAQGKALQNAVQRVLQRADREARPMQLNVFKRARLANTFKWRLLEKGVEREVVDELTQALVLRLTPKAAGLDTPAPLPEVTNRAARPKPAAIEALLAGADTFLRAGDYEQAAEGYRSLLNLDPDHVAARNNLGTVFYKQGLYAQAEIQFRAAIAKKGNFADALCNLGTVLRGRGFVTESEAPLRRALKLKPTQLEYQINLAMTLVLLGRLADARQLLERVLRASPRHAYALMMLGDSAGNEGHMAEAEALYRRSLEADPSMVGAWGGLARLRKMSSTDSEWLRGAEQAAASGLPPVDESTIRFALGKYYDDVGNYAKAFRNYELGNKLQKSTAAVYDRGARERQVDDLIQTYNRDALARERAVPSDSERPVLVVGMMRSGTSLVEQIIASHPAAQGAGELPYWPDAVQRYEAEVARKIPEDELRRKLANDYLRTLEQHAPRAQRVVDKTPLNSDHLGLIHCVLPHARMIYLQRDPIDTCLSCYFQQLSSAHEFALDLADLAHYYREHHRLVAHWREALPPGTLLEVPYAGLTADQEGWTRKIVQFLGLEWDPRCLDFHKTERTVLTASYWQVRQKIYKSSVGRWHNYEKFVGPLRELKALS